MKHKSTLKSILQNLLQVQSARQLACDKSLNSLGEGLFRKNLGTLLDFRFRFRV